MSRFNPRARGGRDPFAAAAVRRQIVSIHAPAGGATLILSQHQYNAGFQSTRPRGARHGFGHPYSNDKCFNPRARGGRDTIQPLHNPRIRVSIHAPAGGATGTPVVVIGDTRFNPRARGGRDI